jgi:tetratricopeptide (TPR) repeat protein
VSQPVKTCPVCQRSFSATVQVCPDDGVLLTSPDPLIGVVLDDRYEILEFIGLGGMSKVYKARQKELDRLVAIKMLKRDLTGDATNIARFRREAAAASQLTHPNLASVYSLGVTPDGVAYIAMEYLQGRSLSAVIDKERPLSLSLVKHIGLQLAKSLGYCHSHDVVHRDLKPSNIMLVTREMDEHFVKVVDFGTAKLMSADQHLTQQGEILGTPMYMSPEQLAGKDVDGRADVFALGRITYEMAVDDLKLPSTLAPVVAKAMAADVGERYQSMEDFAKALEGIAASDKDARLITFGLQALGGQKTFATKKAAIVLLACLTSVVVISLILANGASKQPLKLKEPQAAKIHPQEAPAAAETKFRRAEAALEKGKIEEATTLLQQLIEEAKNNGYYNSDVVAGSLHLIATAEATGGDHKKACQDLEEALALRRSFSTADPLLQCALEQELAVQYDEIHNAKAAEALLTDGMKTIERIAPRSYSQAELFEAYGNHKARSGDRQAAADYLQKASSLYGRSDSMVIKRAQAICENSLAALLLEAGDYAGAVSHARQTLTILNHLPNIQIPSKFTTNDTVSWQAYHTWAQAIEQSGDPRTAEKVLQEFLTATAGHNDCCLERLHAYINLFSLSKARHLGDDLKVADEAASYAEAHCAEHKYLVAQIELMRADALMQRDKFAKAIEASRKALRVYETAANSELNQANVLISIANEQETAGDMAGAKTSRQSAYDLFLKTSPKLTANHSLTPGSDLLAANLLTELAYDDWKAGKRESSSQKLSEAGHWLDLACQSADKTMEKEIIANLNTYGDRLRDNFYDADTAIKFHERAEHLTKALDQSDETLLANCELRLAMDYGRKEQFLKTYNYAEGALALPNRRKTDDRSTTATLLILSGQCLGHLGRYKEANDCFDKATTSIAGLNDQPAQLFNILCARADLERDQRHNDPQLELLNQAEAIALKGPSSRLSRRLIALKKGEFFMKADRLPEARKELSAAMGPGASAAIKAVSLRRLGTIDVQQNKLADALACYERALALPGLANTEVSAILKSKAAVLKQQDRTSENGNP